MSLKLEPVIEVAVTCRSSVRREKLGSNALCISSLRWFLVQPLLAQLHAFVYVLLEVVP